ncbi:hypothetical protein AMC75_08355 [Staphylococcus carnosus]|uniref:hypothetical protein n=1 Tax=Staphylococcus carnosus TaxID=1281 RepID=UPI0006ABDCC6|nr:hypothetical protein [Staphylococcus carnosus]ANZ34581.1 hypothetical protein BEK99_12860 [Staphylococcus carnosus]KOR12490.1 hypothetical protein AMC75_08355 [Staphylococcus carnosus]UTB79675.1 hypothetical protein A2I65_01575 [Staphylococcus carnosus]UTB84443.1 hypothetical protein A2I66_01480 [Staphylococcus carnosus]
MKQKKRVLQFTNLYLAFTEATEKEDKETLNMIEDFINEYQPNLCIFTGNQIYAEDNEKSLALYQSFLEFMNRFDIKIATTFGNRDAVSHDMKSELRKMETKISKNYVEKHYSKVVNHKEAYVIEIKEQDTLLHQLYMIDNGIDGVIDQAHISWLKDVHKATLDQYGYVPQYNFIFSHKPIIEIENVMRNMTAHNNDVSNSEQLLSLIKELGNFDGAFYGNVYDNDFSGNYQGIDLNSGRTSGFSLYTNLAPGARLIELDDGKKYTHCIVESKEDDADELLSEAQLMEEIYNL